MLTSYTINYGDAINKVYPQLQSLNDNTLLDTEHAFKAGTVINNLDVPLKKKIGIKLYDMAIRVFSEFIASRDESKSKGYFVFAAIVGRNGQASKHDVDYLWQRMIEIYGKDEVADDTIHIVKSVRINKELAAIVPQ